MTVLVGLEIETDGEKAVVLASDRLHTEDYETICRLMGFNDPSDELVYQIVSRGEYQGQSIIRAHMQRKISISNDRRRVLSHTGANNNRHNLTEKLLIDTQDFICADRDVEVSLQCNGFPIHELERQELKRLISLYRKLGQKDIPTKELIQLYNTCLERIIFFSGFDYASSYMFALNDEITGPSLFSLRSDGIINRKYRWIGGWGEDLAKRYIETRLGNLSECESPLKISIGDAVDITTGAIKAANEKSVLCDGVDYVVLTRKGVTEGFSDEERGFEISIKDIVCESISREISRTTHLKHDSDAIIEKYFDQYV